MNVFEYISVNIENGMKGFLHFKLINYFEYVDIADCIVLLRTYVLFQSVA